MTRQAEVYNNGVLAGILEQDEQGLYIFTYNQQYLVDGTLPAISLTLPKSEKRFQSHILFPFFFGLLSEGVNRQTQCRLLKIDESDHFGLLLATATSDTIGSITVKEI